MMVMSKKTWVVCILGLCICAVVCWWGSGMGKSDMDKMVGIWENSEGSTWTVEFFEPDESGTSGDMQFVENEDVSLGTYEWHESSHRINLIAEGSYGLMEEYVYNYEFVNDNYLVLTAVNGSEEKMELKRIK